MQIYAAPVPNLCYGKVLSKVSTLKTRFIGTVGTWVRLCKHTKFMRVSYVAHEVVAVFQTPVYLRGKLFIKLYWSGRGVSVAASGSLQG
jgi:hypothetical protein